MEEIEFIQGREEKFVHFKKQGQYSVGKEQGRVKSALPFLFVSFGNHQPPCQPAIADS
jgi:hypothetical protein